jgi:carboxypeptidase C (cathepsin A)
MFSGIPAQIALSAMTSAGATISLALCCLGSIACPVFLQAASVAPIQATATCAVSSHCLELPATSDRGGLLAASEFQPEIAKTEGVANIRGRSVPYRAFAGTIVVHPKGWDDAASSEPRSARAGDSSSSSQEQGASASMFYVAYLAKGFRSADRPITFLYNGGPGSSSIWLHMGAFGPRRVVTTDHAHSPAAPYTLTDNANSLLDASDLVFIDAPGTGFSRIAGTDKEKAFYGVDADAYAFSQFVVAFLSEYERWESPKYLLGESYGTARSAVLVKELETEFRIDLNGVILLSQVLNYDLPPDDPELNPGTEEPYILSLPTYAAIASYYHSTKARHEVPLEQYLREVENFATHAYAAALLAGSTLGANERQATAEKLSEYVGLPVSYILKSDLRINGGAFEKSLLESDALTLGRNDARFSGPSMDPLSREAGYDPQVAAIGSAYVSCFNAYVRTTLGFHPDRAYRAQLDLYKSWDYRHRSPGQDEAYSTTLNVMPDLAAAMKQNPLLKVMVNSGYYDLSTPYYQAWYEDHHLSIPSELQSNIEYHRYESGHMVYVNEQSLAELHDNVRDFIRRTVILLH